MGKVRNPWEVNRWTLMATQEIPDIAVARSIEPSVYEISHLASVHLVILADADTAGLPIPTLLCALFLRHFPALVREGHVFVAMPPLYRIDVGKEVFYALDKEEREGVLDRIKAEKKRGKVSVTRFKGLGEMNPLQLRETTMARDTRRLVRLSVSSGDDTHQIMDMLLSKKRAGDRKIWLEDKGNLAEV